MQSNLKKNPATQRAVVPDDRIRTPNAFDKEKEQDLSQAQGLVTLTLSSNTLPYIDLCTYVICIICTYLIM
jgi:hypothetical protein